MPRNKKNQGKAKDKSRQQASSEIHVMQNSAIFLPPPEVKENKPTATREAEQLAEKAINKKVKRAVLCILVSQGLERLAIFLARASLPLYLKLYLNMSENTSTIVYHSFLFLCYLCPLIGAYIADKYLGKLKVVLYMSTFTLTGFITVFLASIPDLMDVIKEHISLLGLLFISFGTGCIKPCMSSFGADQLEETGKEGEIRKYFSRLYFAIYSGILTAYTLGPLLRKEVSCFGQSHCYTLIFGLSALAVLVYMIITLSGRKWYVHRTTQGNDVTQVGKCAWYLLMSKIGSKEREEFLLPQIQDIFGEQTMKDARIVISIFVLYLPLPIFWALYEQQGSRWIFQASRMDGNIGNLYTIKPDQVAIIGPVILLTLIPIFDYFIYPVLNSCGLLVKPLQKITVGGLLAAAAFIMSGVLELNLEDLQARLSSPKRAQVNLINNLDCSLLIYGSWSVHQLLLDGTMNLEMFEVEPNVHHDISITVVRPDICLPPGEDKKEHHLQLNFTLWPSQVMSVIVAYNQSVELYRMTDDDVRVSDEGDAKFRVIFIFHKYYDALLRIDDGEHSEENDRLRGLKGSTKYKIMSPKSHVIYISKNSSAIFEEVGIVELKVGGVYDILVQESQAGNFDLMQYTIVPPYPIHIGWIIPQIIVLAMAEVMFSITGLDFSFRQAPPHLKAIVQSIWLSTMSIGNLIVIIVTECKLFESQANEFFFFASWMIGDMFLFVILAKKFAAEYI